MAKKDKDWEIKFFDLMRKSLERDARYDAWNLQNKNRTWVVTNMKPGEKDTKQPFKANAFTSSHKPERKGQVLYVPHNCQTPPVNQYPIGTIWECNEYHDKTASGFTHPCYDQWILERSADTKYSTKWVLFKRSFGR